MNEKLFTNANNAKVRLTRYQHALLAAAKEYRNLNRNELKLYALICTSIFRNINVNRVSIWKLTHEGTRITREFLLNKDGTTDEQTHLDQSNFEKYFYALKNKPFIIANDARSHEDTDEFTDSYLVPLDIYSMLDCPIQFNDQVVGVICCEHQHAVKEWNPEDAIFVQALADLISMHMQNEEINRLLNTVQKQNEELTQQTDEIKTINENLESIVRKRTLDLEERNQKLIEYGFINSHLVRAPLARVLGLSDLIGREVATQDKALIDSLLISAQDLDAIISKITNVLNYNQDVSREMLDRDD